MKKEPWLEKFNINKNAETIFYQNPKFFRSNSFKKEDLQQDMQDLLLEAGKLKMYLITGITNNHHKHPKKRQKICLVREFLK